MFGNILRLVDRRVGYFAVAILMVFAVFLPALASAAQISERSIAPSSASIDVEDATYQVKFTPKTNAAAFVVDFCNETPLLGQACTTPTGMDVTGAASTTSGFTNVTPGTLSEGKVVVAGAMTANTPVTVDISGIDNPSESGTVYARIATFASTAAAGTYTSTVPGETVDEGGVAFAITDTIGVSGAVLESLTFCVSGAEIASVDCGGTISSPNLALGEEVAGPGSPRALNPGTLHTGNLYAQISTNAQQGAIVSLKSGAAGCGGLLRAGSSDCDIEPANFASSIVPASDAKFGMLVAPGADPAGGSSNGSVAAMNNYNAANYHMGYNQATPTTAGVTGTYGDQVLNTVNKPVNNKNVLFTFGVSAQNDTPAGMYAADLSLIATGTF